MPRYEFTCANGHTFDCYLKVDFRDTPQTCGCGASSRRIISLPMIHVKPDVHYKSPIDDKPITSMAARKEDMARSGCIEYDPEMKTDYSRRIERDEKSLEASVDYSVDSAIANMPAIKREKLESELNAGFDVTPERITPNVKPLKVEVQNG